MPRASRRGGGRRGGGRSPVDAGGVHQVRHVPARLLDGLEAPLDLVLFGDVTAERHVVDCRDPRRRRLYRRASSADVCVNKVALTKTSYLRAGTPRRPGRPPLPCRPRPPCTPSRPAGGPRPPRCPGSRRTPPPAWT